MKWYKKKPVILQEINPDGGIDCEKHLNSYVFYLGTEKLPLIAFYVKRKLKEASK
jgi:hypothetical protein